jgi:hypothetical protein
MVAILWRLTQYKNDEHNQQPPSKPNTVEAVAPFVSSAFQDPCRSAIPKVSTKMRTAKALHAIPSTAVSKNSPTDRERRSGLDPSL